MTTNDLLEVIVGDITPAGSRGDEEAVRREDGSLPVDEFKEIFPAGKLPGEERGGYHTLAGFVMTYPGRIPAVADHFEWQGRRFEVVDMDGKRIDKVLVAPTAPPSAAAGEQYRRRIMGGRGWNPASGGLILRPPHPSSSPCAGDSAAS